MPRRMPATSLQDRHLILARSQAGEGAASIATALGCSVHTVKKWRRRARQQGLAALSPRIGRPPTGPLSTFPPALSAALRQLRKDHPGWGPVTLLAELRRDPYWATEPLPTRSCVANWLRHAGLTRAYQKQRPLPATPLDAPTAPHEEWQLDAQGAMTVAGVGMVSVINVVDVVSRVKVESYPDVGATQPATPEYQLTLRRAFTTFGLPDRLTLDHGSVFFDNTTPSPFPTLLHLWLLALGIVVAFTRKRCPTDHALVERTHQTITGQGLLGQTWADQPALWAGLDARRVVLNGVLPTAALGDQAPLVACPTAAQPRRPYQPQWEADLLDLRRVDAYLSVGEWFRHSNCHGEFWLGTQRYNVGRACGKRELRLTFDAGERALLVQPVGHAEQRFPIKGLTVDALMGEAGALARLPAYQLALPFTREAARLAELAPVPGATYL